MNLGTAEDGTRAGYADLRSSKDEIKFVYGLEKFFANPHTDVKALEELFRQDTRRDREYIMHVSTHSFSVPAGYSEDDTPEEDHDKYLRSVGAAFLWRGENSARRKVPV